MKKMLTGWLAVEDTKAIKPRIMCASRGNKLHQLILDLFCPVAWDTEAECKEACEELENYYGVPFRAVKIGHREAKK